MTKDNNTNQIALVFGVIGLFLLAAFITRADEQDIKSCMKVTGWSYEKCEMEINT